MSFTPKMKQKPFLIIKAIIKLILISIAFSDVRVSEYNPSREGSNAWHWSACLHGCLLACLRVQNCSDACFILCLESRAYEPRDSPLHSTPTQYMLAPSIQDSSQNKKTTTPYTLRKQEPTTSANRSKDCSRDLLAQLAKTHFTVQSKYPYRISRKPPTLRSIAGRVRDKASLNTVSYARPVLQATLANPAYPACIPSGSLVISSRSINGGVDVRSVFVRKEKVL